MKPETKPWDSTDEASWESFPASDPPGRQPERAENGPSTQLKIPPPPPPPAEPKSS